MVKPYDAEIDFPIEYRNEIATGIETNRAFDHEMITSADHSEVLIGSHKKLYKGAKFTINTGIRL